MTIGDSFSCKTHCISWIGPIKHVFFLFVLYFISIKAIVTKFIFLFAQCLPRKGFKKKMHGEAGEHAPISSSSSLFPTWCYYHGAAEQTCQPAQYNLICNLWPCIARKPLATSLTRFFFCQSAPSFPPSDRCLWWIQFGQGLTGWQPLLPLKHQTPSLVYANAYRDSKTEPPCRLMGTVKIWQEMDQNPLYCNESWRGLIY